MSENNNSRDNWKNAYDYSMKTVGYEALTDKEFELIKEWLEKWQKHKLRKD